MVVGDKVRVIKNTSGHYFKIGEIVELAEEYSPGKWRCQKEVSFNQKSTGTKTLAFALEVIHLG